LFPLLRKNEKEYQISLKNNIKVLKDNELKSNIINSDIQNQDLKKEPSLVQNRKSAFSINKNNIAINENEKNHKVNVEIKKGKN